MAAQHCFSLYTRNRGLLLQPIKAKELDQWLEALDPLLAGTILSQRGMSTKK